MFVFVFIFRDLLFGYVDEVGVFIEDIVFFYINVVVLVWDIIFIFVNILRDEISVFFRVF